MERYVYLTVTDLKEAHAKFHPRERQCYNSPALTVPVKNGI